MTAIAQKLDRKLKQWRPRTARQVRKRVEEIIELADQDGLDLLRSREVEEEALGDTPLVDRVGHTRGRLALRAPAGNWRRKIRKRNWRP